MRARALLLGPAVVLLVAAPLILAGPAQSAGSQAESQAKPFAKHFLALQLSDGSPDKQALVLSVANNLLARYGLDNIDIEVVTFAEGIDLLRQSNPNRVRVESLMAGGVRFDVCQNTLDSIEGKTGQRPDLIGHVQLVTAGVAQLLKLAEKGYTIVRP